MGPGIIDFDESRLARWARWSVTKRGVRDSMLERASAVDKPEGHRSYSQKKFQECGRF